jgi:hypothetical protein
MPANTIPSNNLSGLYDSGNVAIPIGGNVYANNISASGNVQVGGWISAAGNIYGANFIGNLSGNLTVPGSNTQVVYNANGLAGASAGLTFDSASNLLTVSGNTSSAYFLGDGSQLTNLPVQPGTYSNANVAAYLPTYSGNVSAAYFSGDGSSLSNITGANVTGTVANATYATTAGTATSATTAGTVTSNAQANITSVGVLTSLSVSGNINATGNVTGNYILGDGSQLTNLPAGNYSNANVAAYLPTFTGNLTAGNIGAVGKIEAANLHITDGSNVWYIQDSQITAPSGAFWQSNATTKDDYISSTANGYLNLQALYANSGQASNIHLEQGLVHIGAGSDTWTFTAGNITLPGNTSAINYANGQSILSGLAGTYGNANVADYLPTYTGNLAGGNANITGNLAANNISSTWNIVAGADMQAQTGNIIGQLLAGTANISGNLAGGNISSAGNIQGANVVGTYLWGDGSNITGVVAGASSTQIEVKNTSGGSLAKGTPVYATGTVGATDVLEVSASRADTTSTMPCIGLLTSTLAVNDTGYAMSVGSLTGVDTSTYAVGTVLYVAATGGLTSTRPSDNYLIQPVGTVGRVNASTGTIDTNVWNYFQLPNLGNGNIWQGNASNIAVQVTAYGNSNVASYLPTYTGAMTAMTGNITTTGNISGNYILGNGSQLTGITATANAGGSNTQIQFNDGGALSGNANVLYDKASGNITLGNLLINAGQLQNINSIQSNTTPNPGRINVGTGYLGDFSNNADTGLNARSSRMWIADAITKYDTGNRSTELTSTIWANLAGNTTYGSANNNSRVSSFAGETYIINGNVTQTSPFMLRGGQFALNIGNSANTGNANVVNGSGLTTFVQVYAGSSANTLVNFSESATLTGNVGNYIGIGHNGSATSNVSSNVYGIYWANATSTFGLQNGNTLRNAPNYYFVRNDDDVAQMKLGSLRQFHEYRNDITISSGNITVDKANGQVQYCNVTSNITGVTFSNFVTTAATNAQTKYQTDTVTLILRQNATAYSVTLPTGTAYKYAGNNMSVSTTANSVSMVSITGIYNSTTAANEYLITVSPGFV